MINRIKNRLASEQGFTLIELLVVIVILGILAAIAVPAYLSFTTSANQAAAQSNVRTAVTSAEEYYENQTPNSYSNMSISTLQSLTPGIVLSDVVVSTSGASYCIDDSTSGQEAYYIGGADATGTGLPTGYTGAAVTLGKLCPASLT